MDIPEKNDPHWERILRGFGLGMGVGTYRLDYVDPATHGWNNDKPHVPINWTLEGQKADGRSTERRRVKQSKALTGIKRSPETIRKIVEARTGTKASEATRKKMSDSHKGVALTSEHLANLRAAALRRTPCQPTPVLCGHLDKKHYALGKCRSCWERDHKRKK